MQLQRFDRAQNFWQTVQTYLHQNEAEHNTILGIVQTLLHYPEPYPSSRLLAHVGEDWCNLWLSSIDPQFSSCYWNLELSNHI